MSRDWRAYTDSQLKEAVSFAKLLEQLLDQLELRRTVGQVGRPKANMRTILTCLILKSYFRLSYRRLRGLMPLLKDYFKIGTLPAYNTLCKYQNQPRTHETLKKLLILSSLPIREHENGVYAIDSSGMTINNPSRYYTLRAGKKQGYNDFKKLSIMTTTKWNVITSMASSEGRKHDIHFFKPLLKDTLKTHNIKALVADTAYTSRDNVELLDEKGIKPYLKPAKHHTDRKKKIHSWGKMIRHYKTGKQDWEQIYGLRNNVESTFSALKQRLGEEILSKNELSQHHELMTKIICYNICQLIRCSSHHAIHT